MGSTIEKRSSLLSAVAWTGGTPAGATAISANTVGVAGTMNGSVFSIPPPTSSATGVHEKPASSDRYKSTRPPPLHWTCSREPDAHSSPPFGATIASTPSRASAAGESYGGSMKMMSNGTNAGAAGSAASARPNLARIIA